MKAATMTFAVFACFLCWVAQEVTAAPPEPEALSFFDRIFNIPRSVIDSVNKGLNHNGVKCPDGSAPVVKDGNKTCHDDYLGISRSAIDSVNDFLNG